MGKVYLTEFLVVFIASYCSNIVEKSQVKIGDLMFIRAHKYILQSSFRIVSLNMDLFYLSIIQNGI